MNLRFFNWLRQISGHDSTVHEPDPNAIDIAAWMREETKLMLENELGKGDRT